MNRLPTVFLSHGSPLHGLESGAVGEMWATLGRTLPRPRALLMVSAHWETSVPVLSGASKPGTIHDFSGFPEPLYRIRYPAPGAPEVAERARALLVSAGFAAAVDKTRGLDHGAWVPLLRMYPQADAPVLQVSIQTALGAAHHLALGRVLAPLADEGVLVVGSGHMTHNLHEWMRSVFAETPAAYVAEFRDWVDARIQAHDEETLLEYRALAPHALRAHPTEEHFLPLFVALGAAGDSMRAEHVYDAIEGGVLAMDAYVFHAVG
jgi:4,5-DOPA dioxygenase extradiol